MFFAGYDRSDIGNQDPRTSFRRGTTELSTIAGKDIHYVRALLSEIETCLEDLQAIEQTTIDLYNKTSLADYMVIASGRSQRHVSAMADNIQQTLKAKGYNRAKVEGLPQADWVLIDAGDVIVHLFRPEVREFYNLEKMWAPALIGEEEAVS